MTKKPFIVLAAVLFFVFLFKPIFAQATDPDPGLARLCDQQQLKIQALEKDREKMAYEIQNLQDEIRRLKETLERIRSQLGNDRPHPTSYGLPRVE